MKTTKLTKSIAYAYATSDTAEKLGFYENGCYFIKKQYEGGFAFADEQAGGFMDKCQGLKNAFLEADGDICQVNLVFNHLYGSKPTEYQLGVLEGLDMAKNLKKGDK